MKHSTNNTKLAEPDLAEPNHWRLNTINKHKTSSFSWFFIFSHQFFLNSAEAENLHRTIRATFTFARIIRPSVRKTTTTLIFTCGNSRSFLTTTFFVLLVIRSLVISENPGISKNRVNSLRELLLDLTSTQFTNKPFLVTFIVRVVPRSADEFASCIHMVNKFISFNATIFLITLVLVKTWLASLVYVVYRCPIVSHMPENFSSIPVFDIEVLRVTVATVFPECSVIMPGSYRTIASVTGLTEIVPTRKRH